jgi:hypothetical protein
MWEIYTGRSKSRLDQAQNMKPCMKIIKAKRAGDVAQVE